VAQGLPYYERFVTHYPTVRELASAAEEQVLRHWQGLGYYTRARNLHKCAKHIVAACNAIFPDNFSQLKTLPGVGDYTAAAIASFSFKEAVAVVDGNVFRVLSRVFGVDTAINSPRGRKEFSDLANQLIDVGRPDLHNQALMEFGAMLCTPKNPQCGTCPLKKNCHSFDHSLQHLLPVKEKKAKSKKRYFYYLVLQNGSSVLMKRRSEKDIWLGLYDFPVIETPTPLSETSIKKQLRQLLGKTPSGYVVSDTYQHVLTHQKIYSRFVILKSRKGLPGHKNADYYSSTEIAALPKPVLISRFLADYAFLS
jgi:A/G-specific adenine glycosylase